MPARKTSRAPKARRPTKRARTTRTTRTRPPAKPVIRTLTRAACERFLKRHVVGRIGFSFHDRVDIEPIHYVYEDGWLYGRTSPGSKIGTLRHNPWIAFEIDEVRGRFDWESVVVHGTFYVLTPGGTDVNEQAWERAHAAVRRLAPDAWTEDDPATFRTVLFRIHAAEITGRAARS
jgi:uncharacterized protein